jgi:hypothetical protein
MRPVSLLHIHVAAMQSMPHDTSPLPMDHEFASLVSRTKARGLRHRVYELEGAAVVLEVGVPFNQDDSTEWPAPGSP